MRGALTAILWLESQTIHLICAMDPDGTTDQHSLVFLDRS